MMTANEALDRARKIWGDRIKNVAPMSRKEGSWWVDVTDDAWAHGLDGNGHADCHPECTKLEMGTPMTIDLCTAPGAADLTFGSVLSEMISRSFLRVDGRAAPGGRYYTQCLHCRGTDMDRPTGRGATLGLVTHAADCLLAKHLPRLIAMADKGVT